MLQTGYLWFHHVLAPKHGNPMNDASLEGSTFPGQVGLVSSAHHCQSRKNSIPFSIHGVLRKLVKSIFLRPYKFFKGSIKSKKFGTPMEIPKNQ